MHALWWVELGLVPLVGRAMSRCVFGGVCQFSMTLGNLSTDAWDCVPVLLVVWPEVSSTGACRLLGGAGFWCQDGHLQESSC